MAIIYFKKERMSMNKVLKQWDLTSIQEEVKIIQNNDEFVVLDIETVGFKPIVSGDECKKGIIEIAAVKLKNGMIIDKFHSFVNPDQKIPKKITELTGITDEDVKYAPKTNTALWAFSVFVEDAVLVAHNAQFDIETWLKPLMDERFIKFNNEYVCTFRTFQQSIPGLGKGAYTNERMASLFGFKLEGAHRADADVEATAHTLVGLKNWFDGVNMEALIKQKEERELAKADTPVTVKSVNFWERVFGPSKRLKRQYIRVENEKGKGTVFYDLIKKVWRNKDFPAELNFRSVERDTLAFLGLRDVQELEDYRNKK